MRHFITGLFFCLATSLSLAAMDVNKTNQQDLESIKGIGPKVAQMIIAERAIKPFTSWDDLIKRVKGVGPKAAMRFSEGGLTVDKKSYKP
jgi:competence protein ComEA